MRNIIKNNVRCRNNEDKLKLTIYYKTVPTKTLLMRNNLAPPTPSLQQTNLIYEFQCVQDDCEHLS